MDDREIRAEYAPGDTIHEAGDTFIPGAQGPTCAACGRSLAEVGGVGHDWNAVGPKGDAPLITLCRECHARIGALPAP